MGKEWWNTPTAIWALVLFGLGATSMLAFLNPYPREGILIGLALMLIGALLFVRAYRINGKKLLAQLIFKGMHIGTRNMYKMGQIIDCPFFAEVLIENQPQPGIDDVNAVVHGLITFWDKDGKEIFPPMRGRWGHSDERQQDAKPRDQEVRIIIADGYPEPILIALKYQDEEFAYGLNRDNESYEGWRDPKKLIPAGTYSVGIILEGANIARTEFRVTLVNKGKGYGLESILPLIPYKQDAQKQ